MWVGNVQTVRPADTVLIYVNYYTELVPPFIMIFSIRNIDEISPDDTPSDHHKVEKITRGMVNPGTKDGFSSFLDDAYPV